VKRWELLNERQLAVLKAIDASTDLSAPEHGTLRRSASSLRDRGLITISKRGGVWSAEMTKSGRFYLDHGHHPDDPRTSHTENQKDTEGSVPEVGSTPKRSAPHATVITSQQRRAEAEKLVERLVADNLVVIKSPTDDEMARWRKVVDFTKRHNLVPDGHRIEKTRQWNRDRDLHIRLVKGFHAKTVHQTPDDLTPVPIPDTLRSPHSVVSELRDDAGRLVMPKDLRRRCLLILHGLAAEVSNRGHKITTKPVSDRDHFHYSYGRPDGPRYSRREGELDLEINNFTYTVTIQQVSPQSADLEKAQRLVIELSPYHAEGRQYRWADGKVRTVEDGLAALLREAETRAVEDRQRQIDEAHAEAQRKVLWEQAMAVARQKATEAHYAAVLDRQVERWRHADELRAYCEALEQRVSTLGPTDGDLAKAGEWLSWARKHVAAIDPLHAIPTMPNPPELSHEDLKPYLKGWSPYGPEAHRNSWQRRG
jgi:hypothetical protein